jgi:hypothetical protein
VGRANLPAAVLSGGSSGRKGILKERAEAMDKIIRKYTSFDEMKADEYRYWQSRPVWERMDAVDEMIETAYALKGWEMEPDVPRLQRPFVRLPCPWR